MIHRQVLPARPRAPWRQLGRARASRATTAMRRRRRARRGRHNRAVARLSGVGASAPPSPACSSAPPASSARTRSSGRSSKWCSGLRQRRVASNHSGEREAPRARAARAPPRARARTRRAAGACRGAGCEGERGQAIGLQVHHRLQLHPRLPRGVRARTRARLAHAAIGAVEPSGRVCAASAPASRSARTRSSSPSVHAIVSAVWPSGARASFERAIALAAPF